MNQYSFVVLSVILCFFLVQQGIFGQSVRAFTYGGSNGDRNGGKVTIQYLLQDGSRAQKLENSVINLNDYGSGVRLIIQFSDLEVGLKPSGTGMKNSNHYRQYYLGASHQKSSLLHPLGNRNISIVTQGGGLGEITGQLVYSINPVTVQRNTVVKIKTEIIDSNGGRRWNAVPITIELTLLPRTSDIENSIWSPIQKLWEKIEENPSAEDKKTLLEQCLEYRNSCKQEMFPCRYEEEVLYYMIRLTGGDKHKALIGEYKEKYGRKGKYIEELSRIPEVTEPDIPLEAGARLDFDDTYLVVNGVKGGKKNYWVKFFNPGDSLPIHSVDFVKEQVFIDFESLNVDEGMYTVKVTDKDGKVFVENDRVAVNKAMDWPAGVKLSGILLLLAGLGFAYKRFIHF